MVRRTALPGLRARYFHAHAGSADRELKIYEGVYHDPLSNTGRETVLREITGWLLKRVI